MSFEVKNLIDYFVVCGLDKKSGLEPEPSEQLNSCEANGPATASKPPLERSYKSKVLAHFPDNLPWNPFDEDAVAQLCLPKGLIFQKHASKPKFHPFIITREDGSRIYGGALTFYELIEDRDDNSNGGSICNAMQSLQAMYDAEQLNSKHNTANHTRHHKYHKQSSTTSLSAYARSTTSARVISNNNHHQQKQHPSTPIVLSSSSNDRQTTTHPNNITIESLNISDVDEIVDDSDEVERRKELKKQSTVDSESGINASSNSSGTSNIVSESDVILNNSKNSNVTTAAALTTPPPITTANTRYSVGGVSTTYATTTTNASSSSLMSHYSRQRDKLYACKSIGVVSQHPFNAAFRNILSTLYQMVERTDLLGMRFEWHLYNLLYEVPMPPPGQLMQFHVGCKANVIYMPDLSGGSEDGLFDLPLLDYDMFEFFRLLSVQQVLALYVTALLEHQILLYSRDLHQLMTVAEVLAALFFPFTWLKPYVPIVPASNLHFIEAPVPYIMGFHHRDIDKEFFKQGQRCFVDIDSSVITCPEDLPDYPEKASFVKELNEIVEHFQLKRRKIQEAKKQQQTSEKVDVTDSSQALARLTALARKTGALNDNEECVVDSETGRSKTITVEDEPQPHTENTKNSDALAIDEEELVKRQFSRCVRELFLQRFARMFVSYEKFVIMPTSGGANGGENMKLESWFASREYSGINFDAKMFLIEQPTPRVPFLSHFTSTQMFASFVDLKIMAFWQKIDPSVKIFDEKIKQIKGECESGVGGGLTSYDLRNLGCSVNIEKIESEVAKKFTRVHINAPTAVSKTPPANNNEEVALLPAEEAAAAVAAAYSSNYLFEQIEASLVKADDEMIQKTFGEMKKRDDSTQKREKFANQQPKLSFDKLTKSPGFIQSLLKETKIKTKRLLVEKIPEVVHMGHDDAHNMTAGSEENMLMASLCDLIERIWSHGLHNKAGKSALWNHLSNYRKLIQYLHPQDDSKNSSSSTDLDIKTMSPKSSTLPRKVTPPLSSPQQPQSPSSPQLSSPNRYRGSSITPKNNQHSLKQHLHQQQLSLQQQQPHKRAQSVSHHEAASTTSAVAFTPLKNDILGDLAIIDRLTEVKTEIGMARAFVRLAIEKKLLADHFRQLLSEGELLRALYKRHAFLRQEDEREQFLFHLQSLNVVDYFCFTNHFRSIPTDYSILLVSSKKFNSSSTTSANAYVKLFGSLGESSVITVPKNTQEFVFSNKNNLGSLSTLLIGHDNAGMTPRWLVEHVYVRNDISGHIYKFPCGRWLGKGVDDDSLERLLIVEPSTIDHSNDLLVGRSRSQAMMNRAEERNSKLTAVDIQDALGNAINSIVKYFERPEHERTTSLTHLMCSERGLVYCLEHVFTLGFKSFKLFKRLYVWDFLEKAALEFDMIQSNNSSNNFGRYVDLDKFIKAIRSINAQCANFGKDGKFQVFICIGCRESLLPNWFYYLSKSNTSHQMYDESNSFLRNPELNRFCHDSLKVTKQFAFKLEPSLTMKISI